MGKPISITLYIGIAPSAVRPDVHAYIRALRLTLEVSASRILPVPPGARIGIPSLPTQPCVSSLRRMTTHAAFQRLNHLRLQIIMHLAAALSTAAEPLAR